MNKGCPLFTSPYISLWDKKPRREMEKLSELVAEKHGRTIRALRRQMRDWVGVSLIYHSPSLPLFYPHLDCQLF